jgi:hypothetical protein
MMRTLPTPARHRVGVGGLTFVLLALAAPPAVAECPAAFAPTPGMTVYYCTSKIDGVVPKVGPLCHASVAFCPAGEPPVVWREGRWVSNPRCTYFGTQPRHRTFLVDGERVGVTWWRVPLPADVVYERIRHYDRAWRLLWNNCMHAAWRVTR